MSAASVPAEAPEASPQLPPFDYEPMPYTGPSKDAVRSLRKQHLNPGMSVACCTDLQEGYVL